MKHIKYPKIRHLPGSKMSRGDKRLSEEEVGLLSSVSVHISEKVDGAIVAIGMEDGIPQLFKRGGLVGEGEHEQFTEFKSWVYAHMENVLEIPSGWRVYGEWLSVRHTVSYDMLPDYFLAFDIMSLDGFLSYCQVEELLHCWGFLMPVRYEIGVDSIDSFVSDTLSAYSTTDIMEGVVVRDLENTLRGKWVRENFIQGEHWSSTVPKRNLLRAEEK